MGEIRTYGSGIPFPTEKGSFGTGQTDVRTVSNMPIAQERPLTANTRSWGYGQPFINGSGGTGIQQKEEAPKGRQIVLTMSDDIEIKQELSAKKSEKASNGKSDAIDMKKILDTLTDGNHEVVVSRSEISGESWKKAIDSLLCSISNPAERLWVVGKDEEGNDLYNFIDNKGKLYENLTFEETTDEGKDIYKYVDDEGDVHNISPQEEISPIDTINGLTAVGLYMEPDAPIDLVKDVADWLARAQQEGVECISLDKVPNPTQASRFMAIHMYMSTEVDEDLFNRLRDWLNYKYPSNNPAEK
ncbi:MAG: hypothetical protein WC527_00435 [Candidatus Margulisiibacteriota bacterium]